MNPIKLSNHLFISICFVSVLSFTTAKPEILLKSGGRLNKGDYSLASINGAFLRLQDDGNLVLKKGTPDAPKRTIWASGTKTEADCFAIIQVDGNLVINEYVPNSTDENTTKKAIYSTGTVSDSGIYHVAVDSNERIIIVKENKVDGRLSEHWSNRPSHLIVGNTLASGKTIINPDIDAYLTLQTQDGNLVLREGTSGMNAVRVLWSSSATSSVGNYFVKLEKSGLLNVYEGSMKNPRDVLWSSGMKGTSGEYYFTLDRYTNRPSVLTGTPEMPGEVLWEAENSKKPVFVFIDKSNGNLIWINHNTTIILAESVISFDHFDNKAIWSQSINGTSKVFVFDGRKNIAISGDSNQDRNPHISKRRISFEREKIVNGEAIYQVYMSDHSGKNVMKISQFSSIDESGSYLNDDEIVYLAKADGNNDVFHYDGQRNYRITQTAQNEYKPVISKEYIVWADGYNGLHNVLAYNGNEVLKIFTDAVSVRKIVVDRSNIIFQVRLDDITHGIYLWQNDVLTELESGYYNSRPMTEYNLDMKGNYVTIGVKWGDSEGFSSFIEVWVGMKNERLKVKESGQQMNPAIFGNYIVYQEAPGDYCIYGECKMDHYSTWIYNIWSKEHEVIK